MKIALVTIGRLENRYAVEFVQHYKDLGFTHIYIGDNNHDNEEYFEDVLQSYIDENFVTIIDKRNRVAEQIGFYCEMYSKLRDNYDWIAFYDFDEYLTLEKDTTIQEYLSRPIFNDYNQILINWKIYTDNNLIYDDGNPCKDRFTTPMDINKCITYPFPENNHVKTIIKTNKISIINMGNPHVCTFTGNNIKTCNNCGNQTSNSPFQQINYELAHIKHFCTKTIEEYITNKCRRGAGDRSIEMSNQVYTIYRFFLYNEETPEKIKYLKDMNLI